MSLIDNSCCSSGLAGALHYRRNQLDSQKIERNRTNNFTSCSFRCIPKSRSEFLVIEQTPQFSRLETPAALKKRNLTRLKQSPFYLESIQKTFEFVLCLELFYCDSFFLIFLLFLNESKFLNCIDGMAQN